MIMATCQILSDPTNKIITLDRITEDISCLTLSVPSWNRIAVILDSVVMVMASCLTLSDPSWNRIAVILDSVVMVMASCLTVSVRRRKKAGKCTQKQRTLASPQKKKLYPSRGDK